VGVDRDRARQIYLQGEDAVVDLLVELSARVEGSLVWAERLDEAIALAERLAARVEDLELEVKRLTNRSSHNTSLPPSSDLPSAPKRSSKKQSNRKRGGQCGRRGLRRELLEPGDVDHVVDVLPQACSCGCLIDEADCHLALRHQVTDIPPVKPVVTEYRLHRARCKSCRRRVTAPLPDNVNASAFGPRVHATVAYLAGDLRASRERIRTTLRDVFGIAVSIGGVDAMLRRIATGLDDPYRQVLKAVRGSPHVNVDETGWAGRWLWGAFTEDLAVYRVDTKRNRHAAQRLLGTPHAEQVVTSDRHGAYAQYPNRQVCWAHIQRNTRDLTLRSKAAAHVAPIIDQIISDVFDAWHDFHQTGDRIALIDRCAQIDERLRDVLNQGSASQDKATRTYCRRLRNQIPHLWTFALIDGVEPTNNHAERGLRTAVIHRKITSGTHTPAGHHTIERLLTAIQTRRQQGKPIHQYLTDAATAHLSGQTVPTLLPT
jgi:hypothetical protein